MEDINLHKEEDFYLAQWLEGKLSDEELKLRVSPRDFKTYKKLQKGVEILEKLEQPGAFTFDAIQNKIKAKESRNIGPGKSLKWKVSIAATILLLVAVSFLFRSTSTEITTSIAEHKQVTLLDGSQVVLNAKSHLNYQTRDWKSNREVYLEGEAYFKVEKGSTFKVVTPNGTIEVLGTSFNVNTALDYFEVSCYEGKVRVTTPVNTHVLTPTMTVRRINGNTSESGISTNEQPTWVEGESSFKSVPLRYVIDALERQYEIQFDASQIDDSAIFTGSFGHGNMDVALAAVFKTMRIGYTVNPDNDIVLSPYE